MKLNIFCITKTTQHAFELGILSHDDFLKILVPDSEGMFEPYQVWSEELMKKMENLPVYDWGFTQNYKTRMLETFKQVPFGSYFGILSGWLSLDSETCNPIWQKLQKKNENLSNLGEKCV